MTTIQKDIHDLTLRQLYDAQKAFVSLENAQPFQVWKAVMEAQSNRRRGEIFQPLSGSEGVFNQEYLKGEVQGIMLSLGMFQLLKEEVEARIEDKLSNMTPEQLQAEEGREET